MYTSFCYASDGQKPKTIVLSALTDDLQGWVEVPGTFSAGDVPFYKFDAKRENGKIVYYGGSLQCFVSNIDRAQVNQTGIADDVGVELVFDLEDKKVTGGFTGKAVSILSYETMIVNGEYVILPLNSYGDGMHLVTCESTFSGVISGELVHKWGDTYGFKCITKVSVTCKATIQPSPGLDYPNQVFELVVSKSYVKDVNATGSVSYYSAENVQCILSISNDNWQSDPDVFAFHIGGDWGAPCRAARITEWYEDTQIQLTGPAVLTTSTTTASFKPEAKTNLTTITSVDWQLSYRAKGGSWVDFPKITQNSLNALNIIETGASISLEKLYNLTVVNGVSQNGYRSMGLRAKLDAFNGQTLVGSSNLFSFEYRISEAINLNISGFKELLPAFQGFEDETDVELLFTLAGEGKPFVDSIDWEFYYNNQQQRWLKINTYNQKKLNNTKLTIPLESSDLSWNTWLELADSIGRQVNDTKILDMKAVAKATSEDEKTLASSNEWMFRVIQYHRFNLTIAKSIDVYPDLKNSTTVVLDWGGTPQKERQDINVVGLPGYLITKFTLIKEDNAYGKLVLDLEFECTAVNLPPGMKASIEKEVKVRVTCGDELAEKEIIVVARPFDWLVLDYVGADSTPDIQMVEEENFLEIVGAVKSIKTPRICIYTLLDIRNTSKLIKINNANLPGDCAYLFKSVNGETIRVRDEGPTQMSYLNYLESIFGEFNKVPSIKRWLIFSDHGGGIGGIIWDYSEGGHLPLSFLDIALVEPNPKFDLVSFDACLMASLEVMAEIAGDAKLVTASEISEPGDGYNFKDILPTLLSNPGLEPVALSRRIVETFCRWTDQSGTQSAMNNSRIWDIRSALESFAQATLDEYAKNNKRFIDGMNEAADDAHYTGTCPYVDLIDFMQKVTAADGIKGTKVAEEAAKVITATKSVVITNVAKVYDLDVSTSKSTLVDPPTFNGLSVFLWNKDIKGENAETYKYYRNIFNDTNIGRYDATPGSSKYAQFLNMFEKNHEDESLTFILEHLGHELHLKVVDSTGRSVGYDEDSYTKQRILSEIPGSIYYDDMNGTKFISVPQIGTSYKVLVDGSDMEETSESYKLTTTLIKGNQQTKNTLQGTITLGKLVEADLTVSGSEVTLKEKGSGTDQPSSGGIPANPNTSIILGLTLAALMITLRKRWTLQQQPLQQV